MVVESYISGPFVELMKFDPFSHAGQSPITFSVEVGRAGEKDFSSAYRETLRLRFSVR